MIFSQTRAQHVYEAMCLLNNVGGRLSVRFENGTGMYTESSGKIIVYKTDPNEREHNATETYGYQHDFAETYKVKL